MAKNIQKGKYYATLHEGCNYGTGVSAYGNTITEARKNLYKAFRDEKWRKTYPNPTGFLYELNAKGQIKESIGSFTTEKDNHMLWYKPYKDINNYGEIRFVKVNGSLGMSRNSYYNMRNKMFGL